VRGSLSCCSLLELTLFACVAEVHVVNDAPQLTFVQAEYTVEIGEAERIAVDHVTRALPMDANSSAAQRASILCLMRLLQALTSIDPGQ
jgi:hypothetical protein